MNCVTAYPRHGSYDCIYIGYDFTLPITWKTGETKENLTPVDISGYTFISKWYYNKFSGAPIFELTEGAGITIDDGLNGQFTVSLTDTQTADLPNKKILSMKIDIISGTILIPFPVKFFYRAQTLGS